MSKAIDIDADKSSEEIVAELAEGDDEVAEIFQAIQESFSKEVSNS